MSYSLIMRLIVQQVQPLQPPSRSRAPERKVDTRSRGARDSRAQPCIDVVLVVRDDRRRQGLVLVRDRGRVHVLRLNFESKGRSCTALAGMGGKGGIGVE
eukprot:scaffold3494_cov62-Phaeocystis_antarctica.AAC.3